MKRSINISRIIHIISASLLLPAALWYGAACAESVRLTQMSIKMLDDGSFVSIPELNLSSELFFSLGGLILTLGVVVLAAFGFKSRRCRLFSTMGGVLTIIHMIYSERTTQLAEYTMARTLFPALFSTEPGHALSVKYILWGAVILAMLIEVINDLFYTISFGVSSTGGNK